MVDRRLKKALIFQSLFCLWGLSGSLFGHLFAQSIILQKPRQGQALQDPQEFVLEILGGEPSRVELYLNGRLLSARTKAPYQFEVRWDTRYRNSVKFVAYFPQSAPVTLSRDFEEIKTDAEQTVEVVQCFPFLAKPLEDGWRLTAKDVALTPQSFEPAERFVMSLVIVLDISGSMKYSLSALNRPLGSLLDFAAGKKFVTKFLVFDRVPRLIDLEDLPEDVVDLYRGEGRSVVWDAVATATDLFLPGPRRTVLLISDGIDDGSAHSVETVAQYIKSTEASLIWLSPTNLENRALMMLTQLSGGATLYSEGRDPWPELQRRLENQYYLLVRGTGFPIRLKVPGDDAWYPRWER